MTRQSDIADFYQQLALLIRSNLPIPESLRQLARFFPRPEFQKALLDLSTRTERGDKFSLLLRQYPQFFQPFHVQLISAAEISGTLPEVLFIVARSARFAQLLTNRVRDLLGYPMLTVHLCLIIYGLLAVYVIAPFRDVAIELLDGRQLPALTSVVLNYTVFLRNYDFIILPFYIIFLAFSAWLFTPGITSHRAMLSVINVLPGSIKITHSLDSARLCNMLAAFLRQQMPLPKALLACAEMVEQTALQKALIRIEQKLQTGHSLVNALDQEGIVDRLIALTFRHTPEKELPAELDRLTDLYEHRVTLAARSATFAWSMFAIAWMSITVTITVISLFLPFRSVVSMLAM